MNEKQNIKNSSVTDKNKPTITPEWKEESKTKPEIVQEDIKSKIFPK